MSCQGVDGDTDPAEGVDKLGEVMMSSLSTSWFQECVVNWHGRGLVSCREVDGGTDPTEGVDMWMEAVVSCRGSKWGLGVDR